MGSCEQKQKLRTHNLEVLDDPGRPTAPDSQLIVHLEHYTVLIREMQWRQLEAEPNRCAPQALASSPAPHATMRPALDIHST
jgi:hypothetical protein